MFVYSSNRIQLIQTENYKQFGEIINPKDVWKHFETEANPSHSK